MTVQRTSSAFTLTPQAVQAVLAINPSLMRGGSVAATIESLEASIASHGAAVSEPKPHPQTAPTAPADQGGEMLVYFIQQKQNDFLAAQEGLAAEKRELDKRCLELRENFQREVGSFVRLTGVKLDAPMLRRLGEELKPLLTALDLGVDQLLATK